jgi:hypothetical protein
VVTATENGRFVLEGDIDYKILAAIGYVEITPKLEGKNI